MAKLRELPDGFIGQRARAAHDTDMTGRVDVARHDAYFALTRRDHTGAVGADEPALRLFHHWHHPSHVEHRNPLSNGNN